MNLLAQLSTDPLSMGPLEWDHLPPRWEILPGGGIRVTAPEHSDYFQNPAGPGYTNDNAPYLWMRVEGDFVAQANVRPAHDSFYDAGAILVRHDAQNWAKLCYERTDFGTRAAVRCEMSTRTHWPHW